MLAQTLFLIGYSLWNLKKTKTYKGRWYRLWSGLLCHALLGSVTNVSHELAASIFRA